MEFKMNGNLWEIIELEKDDIKDCYIKASGNNDVQETYGYTDYMERIIYINEDMKNSVRRKTLIHELLHCYIFEYCSIEQNEYSEEVMCDICANSHDIIHKIVDDYFKTEVTNNYSTEILGGDGITINKNPTIVTNVPIEYYQNIEKNTCMYENKM